MSRMSDRRETTLNASALAASPATKRETFHWPKYSLIVGTITTMAVKASEAVGDQARPPCRAPSRTRRKSRWRPGAGPGRAAPRRTRPFPSRSRSTGRPRAAAFFGSVPQRAPSVTLKRFPGCFRTVPSGSVRSKGAALSGSSAALEPASRMTSYSAGTACRPRCLRRARSAGCPAPRRLSSAAAADEPCPRAAPRPPRDRSPPPRRVRSSSSRAR